jgi:hypothetical protein
MPISDHFNYTPLILLVLTTAMALFVAIVACKAMLKADAKNCIPRPLMCALIWGVSAFIGCADLMINNIFSIQDIFDLAVLILGIIGLGLLYGSIFSLLDRRGKATALWSQRAKVGGLVGIIPTFLGGLFLQTLADGYGNHPSLFETALVFSWIIPLTALMGVATPQKVVLKIATVGS